MPSGDGSTFPTDSPHTLKGGWLLTTEWLTRRPLWVLPSAFPHPTHHVLAIGHFRPRPVITLRVPLVGEPLAGSICGRGRLRQWFSPDANLVQHEHGTRRRCPRDRLQAAITSSRHKSNEAIDTRFEVNAYNLLNQHAGNRACGTPSFARLQISTPRAGGW